MNHNLTNTELARIFGSYTGDDVLYKDEIFNLLASYKTGSSICENNKGEIYSFDLHKIKLLLTPLEKITEEDAVNMCQIFDIERADQGSLEDVLSWVKALFEEPAGYYLDGYMGSQLLTFVSYLKLKCYDLPQYFGKDHPDNGKTLIQMGIAIDKTELK